MVLSALRLLAALFLVGGSSWADIVEPSTKHVYASTDKSLELVGTGVRVKHVGFIQAKVYSAAIYLNKASAIAYLSKLKGTAPEESIPASSLDKKVVLRMARTVGADKMVEGLADVVRPRMKGLDDAALKSFQSILTAGLGKHGATNNMLLSFVSSGGKDLTVSIDGASKGHVHSPALCKAFVSVYLDDKAVSPSLKDSARKCLNRWCSK